MCCCIGNGWWKQHGGYSSRLASQVQFNYPQQACCCWGHVYAGYRQVA
ncbi:MAG: hypothetical protein IPL28_05200 [Chloroflexi bacterium]|nr:hypothetical protein [Chloroflexota bacterium]